MGKRKLSKKCLLNVQEREGNSLPEIITILAGDFEMFVEFLFDQRIVLYGDCVPHEIL